MNRLFCILLLVLLFFGISGCCPWKDSSDKVYGDSAHNSRNSLDWAGTYHGVLPCADCAGIETWIILKNDLTYYTRSVYSGKSETPFVQQGRFEWDASGNFIQLKDYEGGPGLYQVGENRLFHLNMSGQRITGEMADSYVLHKVVDDKDLIRLSGLAGDFRWELRALGDKQMDILPDRQRIPYIRFDEEENRAFGYSGCNRFTGNFMTDRDNSLTFSAMASTRMACIDMDIEHRFHQVLEKTTSYKIIQGRLTLLGSDSNVLAEFTQAGVPSD